MQIIDRAPVARRAEREPSPHPLLARLQNYAELPASDTRALLAACTDVRTTAARRDIIREGDNPTCVHLILEGWAARYKILPDGSRQITAFLIPGDFCDMHVSLFGEMDHHIGAVTDTKVAYIAEADIGALADRPKLVRAFWWATLVDEAVLRAWIVNLGRRDALQSIAHLLCELHMRLDNVGLVTDGSFEFPVTQDVLADALGLTPVHINRMVKKLRSLELIRLQDGKLAILNLRALAKLAGFNPNYLHDKDSGGE